MKKFFKCIACITIIILFPLIFPLITKLFISVHWFDNIEEFKNYISIFFESGFLWLLIIGMVIIGFTAWNKEEFKNWIKNMNLLLKHKDTSIEARPSEMVDESDKKKKFVISLNSDVEKDKNIIMQEVKDELTKKSSNNKNAKNKGDSNIQALQNENNNLRFYSAYNIINKKTKELLNVIYCDKSMDLTSFKEKLVNSFKNRNKKNKNLTKSQINEYANNKYETIKSGLQYLNIIEISDDDKTITLTPYGKEFVKKYIENEVGENDN